MDAYNPDDVPEGYNIYTYNQFYGEAPKLAVNGLPIEISDASLPTAQPPTDVDATHNAQLGVTRDLLPYSPAFIEMAARSNGAVPHVRLGQPAQPPLWKSVNKALVSGDVTLNGGLDSTSSGTVR
jgi:hypothetical protein